MHVEEIQEILESHEYMIQALTSLMQEQDATMKALNTAMKNYVEQTRPILENIRGLLSEN